MNVRINTSKLIGVLTVSFGLSLIPFVNAVAGIITFNDLTDIVTVTFSNDLTGRATMGNDCGTGEVCTVTLSGPSSALRAFSFDSTINITEPGSQIISDTLDITPLVNTNASTVFRITFTSDTEGVPLLPIPNAGNEYVETGDVQFGGAIVWGDPGTEQTFDTVQFQSDIDSTVPEPSTLSLTLLAFVALVGLRLRHR